jgi:hypothetical protein
MTLRRTGLVAMTLCRFVRIPGTVFLIGATLNFPWEMAQAPLYAPMGTLGQATWRCFRASLGDGVLVLLVWMTGAMIFRSSAWFGGSSKARLAFASIVGLGLATLVELWGLQTQRWSYGSRMPLVPGLAIGLVPLAQMAALVPLTLALTRKIAR